MIGSIFVVNEVRSFSGVNVEAVDDFADVPYNTIGFTTTYASCDNAISILTPENELNAPPHWFIR